MQGRGNFDAWVTEIKISSSINGVKWEDVDNGKVYQANRDRNTKVRIGFDRPVYSRTIRIYPRKWN